MIRRFVQNEIEPFATEWDEAGGFPRELYRLQYPAVSSAELAGQVHQHLQAAGLPAHLMEADGLDHGAWVPLMHLFPKADVPVFQVSMPSRLGAREAWELI